MLVFGVRQKAASTAHGLGTFLVVQTISTDLAAKRTMECQSGALETNGIEPQCKLNKILK